MNAAATASTTAEAQGPATRNRPTIDDGDEQRLLPAERARGSAPASPARRASPASRTCAPGRGAPRCGRLWKTARSRPRCAKLMQERPEAATARLGLARVEGAEPPRSRRRRFDGCRLGQEATMQRPPRCDRPGDSWPHAAVPLSAPRMRRTSCPPGSVPFRLGSPRRAVDPPPAAGVLRRLATVLAGAAGPAVLPVLLGPLSAQRCPRGDGRWGRRGRVRWGARGAGKRRGPVHP